MKLVAFRSDITVCSAQKILRVIQHDIIQSGFVNYKNMLLKRITKQLSKISVSKFKIHNQVMQGYKSTLPKNLNKNNKLSGPLTLQQQIQIINQPKMIKHLQVVEYGVKLPNNSLRFPLALLIVAAFLYYHYVTLPITIVQRFLAISTQTKQWYVGYLGSFFTFSGNSIYAYLPIFAVVNHSTRYFKYFTPLLIPLFLINSYLGQKILQNDLKKFEVWNRQKISYGQGLLHSIGFALWSFFGFKQGLGEAYRSRILLQTVRGIGVVSPGIPIGYIMSFYLIYQIYRYMTNSIPGGRSELILSSMIWGVLYGLIFRRFYVLKK